MLTKLGRTGVRGLRGPRGKTGPSMPRAAVLAIVDDRFTDIHKKLDIQLTRIAQLQQEIDYQRAETVELRTGVEEVRTLVKNLINADAERE